MKKIIALALAVVLMMSVVACGSTDNSNSGSTGSSDTSSAGTSDTGSAADSDSGSESTTEADSTSSETHKVGIALPFMSAEWFVELSDNATAVFEAAGMTVTTVSCEGNAAQQVTDVENLIASGCDIIIIGAADPGTVQGVMEQAKADGVTVITYGFDETLEGVYDINITSGQSFEVGTLTAEIASDWVDETFPDAEDGTVKAAILGFGLDEENTKRDNGLKEISNINSKIEVVDFYDFGTDISDERTTNYIETLLDKYPDINVILGHDSAQATVTNEVIMRTAGIDTDQIGVFAAGTSQDSLLVLQKSVDGNSVVRGLLDLGDIGPAFYEAYLAFLNGELADTNGCYKLPMNRVEGDNVSDYIK